MLGLRPQWALASKPYLHAASQPGPGCGRVLPCPFLSSQWLQAQGSQEPEGHAADNPALAPPPLTVPGLRQLPMAVPNLAPFLHTPQCVMWLPRWRGQGQPRGGRLGWAQQPLLEALSPWAARCLSGKLPAGDKSPAPNVGPRDGLCKVGLACSSGQQAWFCWTGEGFDLEHGAAQPGLKGAGASLVPGAVGMEPSLMGQWVLAGYALARAWLFSPACRLLL